MQSQKRQNDLCSFPRQTIQYHGNPSYAPTSNAEEDEVEWFYEDLQDLLELTAKKDVLFIIRDWSPVIESHCLVVFCNYPHSILAFFQDPAGIHASFSFP